MRYLPDYWNDVELIIRNIPNLETLFNKTILITGSTGMVCSPIVDIIAYLNKTKDACIKLILLGRSKEKIKNRFLSVMSSNDYQFYEFDATKYTDYSFEVDYIIHGASNADPSLFSKEPVETFLCNIFGLYSMLELAKKNDKSRLLFVSSSEVYGNRQANNIKPYREDEFGYVDILNPRASYPSSKRAAETLCSSYSYEYGVDSVIVRLGHIYGPSITNSDSRASSEFSRNAKNKQNIIMKSPGTQLRSYCYSLDCASAILAVLVNGLTCNSYNVSNSNSIVSIRELAEKLASIGNVNLVFVEVKSYNLMDNSALNSEKIEALGWKANFNLHEGIIRTLKYM